MSICYEALPFLFDFKLKRTSSVDNRSTVVVVSPLISLMTDQVTSLRQRGVSAVIHMDRILRPLHSSVI